MPSVDQQQQAVEAFGQIDQVRHIQAETATELEALLPAVLDRAFRGEL